MKKGTFCISFDTELLWGRHDLNYKPFISRAKKERKIIKELLYILGSNQVPATWAIVGKLLEKPKKLKTKSLWYAPDIVQMIKNTNLQEIGSHSYGHNTFDALTNKEAENDIKKAVAILKKIGITPRSFVFPRNKINHTEVLKKYGFKIYRVPLGPGSKLSQLREFLIRTPQPVLPIKEDGLTQIPGNYYYLSARGMRKFIPPYFRYWKARQGIDLAIKKGKIFHLWTHPGDLADQQMIMINDFRKIVQYAAKKRDEGKLNILSMGELAK